MTLGGSCVHYGDEPGSNSRGLAGRRIIVGTLAVRRAESADERVIRRLPKTGRVSSRKPWPERPGERSPVAEERAERRVNSDLPPPPGQNNDPVANLGWEARRDLGLHPGLPESGWRRFLALWGFTAIPFFRAFDDSERCL